jgi:hypothetical protein
MFSRPKNRKIRAAAVAPGLALPIYAVALILDYLAGALGRLAAVVAGDDWPR